jgi:hypothetical protein
VDKIWDVYHGIELGFPDFVHDPFGEKFFFEELGPGRTWYVHGSSSAQTSPPKLDGLLFVKPTVTDPFQWLIGTHPSHAGEALKDGGSICYHLSPKDNDINFGWEWRYDPNPNTFFFFCCLVRAEGSPHTRITIGKWERTY